MNTNEVQNEAQNEAQGGVQSEVKSEVRTEIQSESSIEEATKGSSSKPGFKKPGFINGLKKALAGFSAGILGDLKVFLSLAGCMAAVLAAFLFSLWLQNNFSMVSMAVYDGVGLCEVTSEDVFLKARQSFVSAIAPDTAYEAGCLTNNVLFKKTIAKNDEIENESAVKTKLLSFYDDKLCYGCGIYVDGSLVCVAETKKQADEALDKMKDEALAANGGERAYIYENVNLSVGYFKSGEALSADELYCTLCGKDGDAPLLHAATVKTEVYENTLEYTTQYEYLSDEYDDYYATVQYGQNGYGEFTDLVTYVDGQEKARENISYIQKQEMVPQIIEIGTKERPSGIVPGVSSGLFTWPTPTLYAVTSYYGDGRGHKGLDISGSGAEGEIIVASDAGVVESASYGWSGGYGNCVVIDHGNGYKTRYAHCCSLNVYAGQSVAKGEIIAYVGDTGDSDGAHLHFEIIVNGYQADPYAYLY